MCVPYETMRLGLPVPIPKLATLVAASPFDAALHDACGRAVGRPSFRSVSPELVGHDLARYLGPDFAGMSLQDLVRPEPAATVPMFHSVGGSDPLTAAEADAADVPRDGLPRTLAEWIRFNGLWNGIASTSTSGAPTSTMCCNTCGGCVRSPRDASAASSTSSSPRPVISQLHRETACTPPRVCGPW